MVRKKKINDFGFLGELNICCLSQRFFNLKINFKAQAFIKYNWDLCVWK